jgi:hypothetical protein
MFTACGEETPCERMHAIQKDICKVADKCFPCVCVLRGKKWDIPLRMGLPDFPNASCSYPLGPCEGTYREWAEGCLELGRQEKEDENFQAWVDQRCDPRYEYGIWLYDDNETYNPATPEICSGEW